MTWSWCVEHGRGGIEGTSKKNIFVAGVKNYKHSTFTDNEKSKLHLDATIVRNSKKEAHWEEKKSTAHKTVIALKEHTRKQMEVRAR
jgi:hypothetical protein